MIYAYDKVYLEKARTSLARMLDFAVYDLNYDIEDFQNSQGAESVDHFLYMGWR